MIRYKSSVLDACLKVGGLLGFLKIFSSMMSFVHQQMFKKELKRMMAVSSDLESENNR